jgi:repressor LexA
MKRREMIYAINYLTEKQGYPPSVHELADAVNLTSTSAVQGHLESLKKVAKLILKKVASVL